MSKLINFSKGVLKHFTYLELMQTVTERINAALSVFVNPVLRAVIDEFLAAVKQMDEEYKKATSSVLTVDLSTADEARDNAHGSFSAVVTAFKTAGVEVQHAASEELRKVLNTYKVNTHAQINEESGAILQLCQELDRHAEAIATLGLTEVYAELKRQNDLVRQALKDRNEQQAFDLANAMKKNRVIVDALYDRLMDTINAVLLLQPTPELERFVTILNKDIDYVRIHNGMGSALSEGTTTAVGDDSGTDDDTDTDNGTTPTPPADGDLEG